MDSEHLAGPDDVANRIDVRRAILKALPAVLHRAGGVRWNPLAASRPNFGVTSEPMRAVLDHLSEIVDRVERAHDRVVITRNGRDTDVLMSAAVLAELEETLSVLSDPAALADIREADTAYTSGEVVRGTDAVRALRP